MFLFYAISAFILFVLVVIGIGRAVESMNQLARRLRDRRIQQCAAPFRYFVDPQPDFHKWFSYGFIEFRAKKLAVTTEDLAAMIWLRQLGKARRCPFGERSPPLVRFNREFRTIVDWNLLRPLLWCLSGDDQELRSLATFLLGRLKSEGVGRHLLPLKRDRHAGVRREVARALRRKAAFVELHEMTMDPDPRVRDIATTILTRRHPYVARLAKFTSHSDVLRTERDSHPAAMRLFLHPSIGDGKPPKSRFFIRQILEHIRQLVRGWRAKNHAG